jgi:hypothetical protein
MFAYSTVSLPTRQELYPPTFKAMHWELLLLFSPRCLALEKLQFSEGWRETVEITRVFLPPAAANWREIKLRQTTVCEIVPNRSLKLGGKKARLCIPHYRVLVP